MEGSATPLMAMRAFNPQSREEDWNSFVALFDTLHKTRSTWPSEMEVVASGRAPSATHLRGPSNCARRISCNCSEIASTYASREQFLTAEVTLDPPAATGDEAGVSTRDDDYLILSTIHSAKGQEWKVVQILM
jgi:DNA helicase-2/ATP-dependent DNA helicase PcrA